MSEWKACRCGTRGPVEEFLSAKGVPTDHCSDCRKAWFWGRTQWDGEDTSVAEAEAWLQAKFNLTDEQMAEVRAIRNPVRTELSDWSRYDRPAKARGTQSDPRVWD